MDVEAFNQLRNALYRLPATQLADALLSLSEHDALAMTLAQRLVATPEQRLRRARRAVNKLGAERRKFVEWRQVGDYARELQAILDQLRESECDPATGLDLLAEFYAKDAAVMNSCDDSSGTVGDVFQHDACRLWAHYAERYEDKADLIQRVEQLLETDDYGVRESVLRHATDWLPQARVRELIDRFWDRAEDERARGKERPPSLQHVRSLAKQLKDPELFERATIVWSDGKSAGRENSIAEVYLESQRPQDALQWLDRGAADGPAGDATAEELRLRAYVLSGNREAQAEILQAQFLRHPSRGLLEQCGALLGEAKRAELIAQIRLRLQGNRLRSESLGFLLELGHTAEVARHIVEHRAELNGDGYTTLLGYIERLEPASERLAVTCLYRSLLDSILERAQTKTYPHGARYWQKLEALASTIANWDGLETHEQYAARVAQQHKRKSSFWACVRGAGARAS